MLSFYEINRQRCPKTRSLIISNLKKNVCMTSKPQHLNSFITLNISVENSLSDLDSFGSLGYGDTCCSLLKQEDLICNWGLRKVQNWTQLGIHYVLKLEPTWVLVLNGPFYSQTGSYCGCSGLLILEGVSLPQVTDQTMPFHSPVLHFSEGLV